ncbi:MAG: lytic transglycosylase domain-containing protein [Deltaproteobacteria bacterium]|jgi:hypothetical protein|nr:lytic transglycosylase domain-containing protein [Deltaproteobacteria bacterium]
MSSYYYTNRIDNFDENKNKKKKKSTLNSYVTDIFSGNNFKVLFIVPAAAFMISAAMATHSSSSQNKTQPKGFSTIDLLAQNAPMLTPEQLAKINLNISIQSTPVVEEAEPVFKKRPSILSSDVLEQRRQIQVALLKNQTLIGTKNQNTISQAEIVKDQQGQIKFISGMIAALRPKLENSGEIAKHIVELSHEKKIDPLFVAAVISVESMFKADAKSHVGAMGLMQLMPETAKDIAKSNNINLNHPRTNISYGIDYLKWLEKKYKGNRTYMLAAYNWGPGNVDKVLQGKYRTPSAVSDYASTIITRATHWKRHYETANTETNIIGAKLSKKDS